MTASTAADLLARIEELRPLLAARPRASMPAAVPAGL
jgi:hypothetical protein